MAKKLKEIHVMSVDGWHIFKHSNKSGTARNYEDGIGISFLRKSEGELLYSDSTLLPESIKDKVEQIV